MQIIRGIEQGSVEWLKLRAGKASASKAKAILTQGTKGVEFGETFLNYAKELAVESILGEPLEKVKSFKMERGNEYEPIAAMNYSLIKGKFVEEITGILVNDNVWVSPDRLVDNDGMLEIKCPDTITHVTTILNSLNGIPMPSDYIPQVQFQLWGAEREWNDFMSFDDRWITPCFFYRTYRDEELIKKIEHRTKILIEKRDEYVELLKNYKQ